MSFQPKLCKIAYGSRLVSFLQWVARGTSATQWHPLDKAAECFTPPYQTLFFFLACFSVIMVTPSFSSYHLCHWCSRISFGPADNIQGDVLALYFCCDILILINALEYGSWNNKYKHTEETVICSAYEVIVLYSEWA